VAIPTDLQEPAPPGGTTSRSPPGGNPSPSWPARSTTDLDELTARIVACIDAEIPAYRAGPVPREDLAASIRHNVGLILLGIAERREPTAAEIRVRRELGTRRAIQGMPVDALLEAYNVGYRELWASLVRAVPPTTAAWRPSCCRRRPWRGAGCTSSRTRSPPPTSAPCGPSRRRPSAHGNGSSSCSSAGTSVGTRRTGSRARSGSTRPDRSWSRCCAGSATTSTRSSCSGGWTGRAAGMPSPPAAPSWSRPASGRELVDPRGLPQPRGLDHRRRRRQTGGLGGARDSLRDAELTLSVLEPGATATFEDAWLWATLAGAAPRLRTLLADGARSPGNTPPRGGGHRVRRRGVLRQRGRAAAVLHANTVAYRLDRWGELTGWNPRRFPGLVRSLAALRLQRPVAGPRG
jgi:hypothetical protein